MAFKMKGWSAFTKNGDEEGIGKKLKESLNTGAKEALTEKMKTYKDLDIKGRFEKKEFKPSVRPEPKKEFKPDYHPKKGQTKIKGDTSKTQKPVVIEGQSKTQDPDWKGEGHWIDAESGKYRGIGNYQENTATGQVRTWMPGSKIYDDETTQKIDSMTNVINELPDWTSPDYDEEKRHNLIQERKRIRESGTVTGQEPNTWNYM